MLSTYASFTAYVLLSVSVTFILGGSGRAEAPTDWVHRQPGPHGKTQTQHTSAIVLWEWVMCLVPTEKCMYPVTTATMNSGSCGDLQVQTLLLFKTTRFCFCFWLTASFKYIVFGMVTKESFFCVWMHMCGVHWDPRWHSLGTTVLLFYSCDMANSRVFWDIRSQRGKTWSLLQRSRNGWELTHLIPSRKPNVCIRHGSGF